MNRREIPELNLKVVLDEFSEKNAEEFSVRKYLPENIPEEFLWETFEEFTGVLEFLQKFLAELLSYWTLPTEACGVEASFWPVLHFDYNALYSTF